MFFSVTLYLALLVCGIGLLYKVVSWFRHRIGKEASSISAGERLVSAAKGVLAAVLSPRIGILIKVFILDVLLQRRVFKESRLRWAMHMCIYGGFMLLLFMHALDTFVSMKLFSEYHATLNPFLFLRNLFGAMVVIGVLIAIYRRMAVKRMRITSGGMDVYAIVILAVILVSGFLLEGAKIVSHKVFQDMVDEWAFLDDEELASLQAYWAKEFSVVFPERPDWTDEAVLEQGRELHEISCADCHSKPQWAFVSYGTAKLITPVAVKLTDADAAAGLWYIHILACFLGLAYLPFSKFLHIFASPVSLLVNAVMKEGKPAEANVVTRRAMELDACTHCGACSEHCSVGVIYEQFLNRTILPSEKLIALRSLASGKSLGDKELQTIQEGSFICTNCYRCTQVCPVGINLQDLWITIKEDLAVLGYPEPVVWAADAVEARYGSKPLETGLLSPPAGIELQKELGVSLQADTFSRCFECQTCTNVCPVVNNFENPKATLGLLPHQIMHSLGLGLKEHAMGNRMIWDCVTCYQCQEQCPQGVQVADVLYELRNMSYRHLKGTE